MKIGVGITTRNRHDILAVSMDYHARCASKAMKYVIVDDASDTPVIARPHIEVIRNETRLGIAKSKNKCLAALKDCDYIFLFDDDAFPTFHEWAQRYIDAHIKTGIHHFLHLKEVGLVKKRGVYEINDFLVDQYTNCGGVMLFLTQKVLKTVGGYNAEHGIYGFEHAGYTHRIHRAELTRSLPPYLAIPESFIWAMDWDGVPSGSRLTFRSSVTREEADESANANRVIYLKECEGRTYFPFE
jgi:hypothetical protein